MTPNPRYRRNGVLILAAAALACPALAERADRDKPINLEADRITVNEATNTQVFEGNVQLVQGTLVIRTAKLVVTQDADGFQKGIAYGGAGGLAHFRQKREGKDEYITGEAERIEYDGRTDKAQLFNRAHVTSGQDDVRGPYISYDGMTENYVVANMPGSNQRERVHAVIQPKTRDAEKQPPAVPTTSATAATPKTGSGETK
jgi:lipopolysaccharide export system protein LptA